MTALPAPRPAITTRPFDAATERNYVWSTARAVTASHWGGQLCHFQTVSNHVDAILTTCVVVVATFEGDPASILGYVAWGLDGTVEFLVLNKSLADDGRASPAERPPKGYRLRARQLALDVLRSLLQGEPAVVMRRPAGHWVMEAVLASGVTPSVVPRGV